MKIKTAIFLFLGLFIIYIFNRALLNTVLTPTDPWDDKKRFEGFYQLEENSLDYLVFGSSQAIAALNPMQVYGETGITGYHLGNPNQPQELSYYWLQDALKNQSPQYVFLDVGSLLYTDKQQKPAMAIRGLIFMRPSLNRWNAVLNTAPDINSIYTLSFPIYGLHTRWSDLKRADFNLSPDKSLLKGAVIIFKTIPFDPNSVELQNESAELSRTISGETIQVRIRYGSQVTEEVEESFKAIYDLCQDKGITLVPVKFATSDWSDEQTDIVVPFLAKYDLELLDFASQEAVNIDWAFDSFDRGHHTNYYGMTKVSAAFSQKLKSLDGLKDHRGESGYQSWDKDLRDYLEWEESNLLALTAVDHTVKSLSDGIYQITPAGNTGRQFEAAETDEDGNVKLVINNESSQDTQKFWVEYTENGLYTIRSQAFDQYLSVKSTKTGYNIVLQDFTGSASQKWIISSCGEGSYQFISLYNGLAIDTAQTEDETGNKIHLWQQADTDTQKFAFIDVVR